MQFYACTYYLKLQITFFMPSTMRASTSRRVGLGFYNYRCESHKSYHYLLAAGMVSRISDILEVSKTHCWIEESVTLRGIFQMKTFLFTPGRGGWKCCPRGPVHGVRKLCAYRLDGFGLLCPIRF